MCQAQTRHFEKLSLYPPDERTGGRGDAAQRQLTWFLHDVDRAQCAVRLPSRALCSMISCGLVGAWLDARAAPPAACSNLPATSNSITATSHSTHICTP